MNLIFYIFLYLPKLLITLILQRLSKQCYICIHLHIHFNSIYYCCCPIYNQILQKTFIMILITFRPYFLVKYVYTYCSIVSTGILVSLHFMSCLIFWLNMSTMISFSCFIPIVLLDLLIILLLVIFLIKPAVAVPTTLLKFCPVYLNPGLFSLFYIVFYFPA